MQKIILQKFRVPEWLLGRKRIFFFFYGWMEEERDSGESGPSGSALKPSGPFSKEQLDWEGANEKSRVTPAKAVRGECFVPASGWQCRV